MSLGLAWQFVQKICTKKYTRVLKKVFKTVKFYSKVFKGCSKSIQKVFKKYSKSIQKVFKKYSKVFKGIQKYSKVFKGIKRGGWIM